METSKIFVDENVSLTNNLLEEDFSDLSDIEIRYNDKNAKIKKLQEQNINTNGPLNGNNIVLTGEMMISKDYLKIILINLGAKFTSA